MTFASAVEHCKIIIDTMDSTESERADELRVVLECACEYLYEYLSIPECLTTLPEECIKGTWSIDTFLELVNNYREENKL